MKSIKIAAKIWLSVAIFVLGFVFVTALHQIQGVNEETRLRGASAVLLPAVLQSRLAVASFERASKEFGDGVVTQDLESIKEGAVQGRLCVASLNTMASLQGLAAQDARAISAMASRIREFLRDAEALYRAAAAGSMSNALQTQIHELASRSRDALVSLRRLEDRFSGDLRSEMDNLESESVRQRWVALLIFALTLGVSAILVELTIRHSVVAPLLKAEVELERERDLLRTLLDNVPDCIYFKDTGSRFTRVNKAQAHLLGIEHENDCLGRTDFEYFDAEHASEAFEDEQEIVRGGKPLVGKIERVSGTGKDRQWMTSTKVPVKDATGTVTGIVGISRSITDLKNAVEALEKSEESFRSLFAVIPHAVWVFDSATLEVLEVNDTAVRDYGYTAAELREIGIVGFHPPEEAGRLPKAFESSDPAAMLTGTWKHQTKDGRLLYVETVARAFEFRGHKAVLLVAQDVTDRKRLELELHQAQRLEAVGQLAAGIAHEINTPIQYVGDNIRFVYDAFIDRQFVFEKYSELHRAVESGTVPPGLLAELSQAIEERDLAYLADEIPRALAQSQDGVAHVATIVRAMKDFAHPGGAEKTAANLNKAIADALIVARNEFKYVADAETDYGELPMVFCNVAEINQVLLNLLVNAAHAIGEVVNGTGTKGKITIQTRAVDDRVVIRIGDTGCGIPESIRAKIFDPFFTTKPVGRGTGQGLSIARTIVAERHGGSLTFEPNGTQGTTFIVSLPIAQPGTTASMGETS